MFSSEDEVQCWLRKLEYRVTKSVVSRETLQCSDTSGQFPSRCNMTEMALNIDI